MNLNILIFVLCIETAFTFRRTLNALKKLGTHIETIACPDKRNTQEWKEAAVAVFEVEKQMGYKGVKSTYLSNKLVANTTFRTDLHAVIKSVDLIDSVYETFLLHMYNPDLSEVSMKKVVASLQAEDRDGIYGSLKRVRNLVYHASVTNDRSLLEVLHEHVTSEQLTFGCKMNQTPQEIFMYLFIPILISEFKTYGMLMYTNEFQANKKNFTVVRSKSYEMLKDMLQNIVAEMNQFQEYMGGMSNLLYNCEDHPESFQMYMGVIDTEKNIGEPPNNKRNALKSDGCSATCETIMPRLKMQTCKSVSNVSTLLPMDGTVVACRTSENEISRVLLNNVTAFGGEMEDEICNEEIGHEKTNSGCDVCFGLCHLYSYVYLDGLISHSTKNMVVTGIKLNVNTDRKGGASFLSLSIQEGKLQEDLTIDHTTVSWQSHKEKANRIELNSEDLYILQTNVPEPEGDNYVVTGVKYHISTHKEKKVLQLLAHFTPYNKMGVLEIADSYWSEPKEGKESDFEQFYKRTPNKQPLLQHSISQDYMIPFRTGNMEGDLHQSMYPKIGTMKLARYRKYNPTYFTGVGLTLKTPKASDLIPIEGGVMAPIVTLPTLEPLLQDVIATFATILNNMEATKCE